MSKNRVDELTIIRVGWRLLRTLGNRDRAMRVIRYWTELGNDEWPVVRPVPFFKGEPPMVPLASCDPADNAPVEG